MSLAAIVLSCDRPAQLELCLRSLRENARDSGDYAITVLFKATSAEFAAGYDEVAEANPEVAFCAETDELLLDQLDRILARSSRPFFAFLVDDDVFIREFSTRDAEFLCLAQERECFSLSLRLHPFEFYCQPLARFARPPIPVLLGGVRDLIVRGESRERDRSWSIAPAATRSHAWIPKRWREFMRFPAGDWACRYSVDGNVFRMDRFREALQDVDHIDAVTEIEPALECLASWAPRMLCYHRPRLINLAMNRVDEHHRYPSAEISHHEMNERFRKGYRLDYTHLRGRRFASCHLAQEPVWLPPGSTV